MDTCAKAFGAAGGSEAREAGDFWLAADGMKIKSARRPEVNKSAMPASRIPPACSASFWSSEESIHLFSSARARFRRGRSLLFDRLSRPCSERSEERRVGKEGRSRGS